MSNQPNYKLIYQDIIQMNFPHKIHLIESFLNKNKLNTLHILMLNKLIFGKSSNKHKCYSKEDIQYVLEEQRLNKWNNIETSKYFNISRNTLTKWKKEY